MIKQRTLQQDLAVLIRGCLLVGVVLTSMWITRNAPGGNAQAGALRIRDYIILPLYVILLLLIASTFSSTKRLLTRWITYLFRDYLDREFPHTLVITGRRLIVLCYFIFYFLVVYFLFIEVEDVFRTPDAIEDQINTYGSFIASIIILLMIVMALLPLIMLTSTWAEGAGSGPACSQCGSRDHRLSAAYCFMCRTRLESTQVMPRGGRRITKLVTQCPACSEDLKVLNGYGKSKIRCPACSVLFEIDKDELRKDQMNQDGEEDPEIDYEIAERFNIASRAMRGLGSRMRRPKYPHLQQSNPDQE